MLDHTRPQNHLGTICQLLPDQIERYRHDGHILLRGLASPDEISTYPPSIQEVLQKVSSTNDAQGRIEDYSRLFTQVTNVWRLNEYARKKIAHFFPTRFFSLSLFPFNS